MIDVLIPINVTSEFLSKFLLLRQKIKNVISIQYLFKYIRRYLFCDKDTITRSSLSSVGILCKMRISKRDALLVK